MKSALFLPAILLHWPKRNCLSGRGPVMKRTFFLLCAVLLVAGSLLPLAGYRLATAALGRAAPDRKSVV